MRFWVLLHLYAVVVWIGGMAFAHFCLRPVAAAQLPPPQRLPLMSAVLGRFFAMVAVALLLLWASGLVRFFQVGSGNLPLHWHIMAGLGAAMTAVFLVIVLRYHPRLKRAVAAQTWPAGGAAMDLIRRLVMLNLALGVATVAVAVLGA